MKATAIACLCLLLLAAPAAAQESEAPPEEKRPPEEMAREGVELLLRALRGFLQAVPQYGLPRLNEEGDIVIPRLDRNEAPDEKPAQEPDPEEPDLEEPDLEEPDPDTGGIRT